MQLSCRCAFDYAHNHILLGLADEEKLQTLRRLFPDRDNRLESRHFSRLHKIVLGLFFLDLEQELRIAIEDINAVDCHGRTALSWAIQRQNVVAAEILLNAKADPNISSVSGSSPLDFAAWLHDLTLVNLLLRSGASTTHVNCSSITALHFASRSCMDCNETACSSPQIIKLLLSAGCHIEQRNTWGITPIMHAAGSGNVHAIQVLLDHGAGCNSCDNEGDTPLSDAIRFVRDDAIQLLIRKGANYKVANKAGWTVLHVAAQYGTIRTIEILHAANMVDIDPYAKNKDGKKAFELAQQREEKPKDFIDLFLTMLFEIRNRNDYLARQRGNSTATVVEEVEEEEEEEESS